MPVSLDGLHPTLMRPRVEALLADPDARSLGLHVVSAFRSVERQRVLWDAAVRKYGSERAAAKWVARPGRSNHGPKVDGYGIAVDLGLPDVAALDGQWPPDVEAKVNAVAARHGLFSPMQWEDWHFESIPNWSTTAEATDMPPIFKSAEDAENYHVRMWFLEHVGHPPRDHDEQQYWTKRLRERGADVVLAEISDSPTARARRAAMDKLLDLLDLPG